MSFHPEKSILQTILWRCGLGAVVIAGGMTLAHGDEPAIVTADAQATATDLPAAPAPLSMTLEDAVRNALSRQPNIAAARASLNSAAIQSDAANSRFAMFMGPSARVRGQQASLGVAIAQANLSQAEQETIQAVTRTYLSALFAEEQSRVADETVKNFDTLINIAKKLVDAGSKDVTADDLDRLQTYGLMARTRLSKATSGGLQARAALREAIGLGHTEQAVVAADKLSGFHANAKRYLTEQGGTISVEMAVEAALQHRPELTQVSLFAEVVCLEREAQGMSHHINVPTFAARTDIHGKALPVGQLDPDYRPGPLPPDMPTMLSGMRNTRQERAGALYDRAVAGSNKARGLVVLEVESLAARLADYDRQVDALEKAAKNTDKIYRQARTAYQNDQLKTDQMVTAQVLDAQTRAELNEAYFNYGITLAALQRATGGKLWECIQKAK
jgi:outer membrane protein TolC